jgi:hypothetical protein
MRPGGEEGGDLGQGMSPCRRFLDFRVDCLFVVSPCPRLGVRPEPYVCVLYTCCFLVTCCFFIYVPTPSLFRDSVTVSTSSSIMLYSLRNPQYLRHLVWTSRAFEESIDATIRSSHLWEASPNLDIA